MKYPRENYEFISFLTNPNFHKLNEHNGRNDRLLHAVMVAYLKHHVDHSEVESEWLSDLLCSVICNEIGDDNFCEWLATMQDDNKNYSHEALDRESPCFDEGYDAYKDGTPDHENHYNKVGDQARYESWRRGWLQAYDEDMSSEYPEDL